jgi:hypothetical protein
MGDSTQRIQQAIDNANQEVGRGALDITPVRLDSIELYAILRTRLFERMADGTELLGHHGPTSQTVSLPRRLNHHHSGAAFEGGGRDEAVCPAQRARRRPDDGGVADSRCHRPQRNDDGVADNLCRPAARSVARCNTCRVRSLGLLRRSLG